MLRIALLAWLTLGVSLGYSAAHETTDDREELQGRWKLTEADDSDGLTQNKGFVKYTLVIKGREIARESEKTTNVVFRPFKIAPDKAPKQIDFTTGGKQEHDRVGIYSLDGDRLRICFSTVVPADESRRPKDFTAKPGSGRVLLFFERVAAPQSVSTDEFSQLSEEEQLKSLRELLLKYRRLTGNMSASAKVSVKNLSYDPKTRKVGNEVTDVGRTKHYELRRIGPSYRVTEQQLPLEKKPNVYYPFVIESYDAKAGLRRQLTTLAEEGLPTRHHGSISTKRGRAAEGCLFYQYFGDETARGGVSLVDVGTRFLRSFEDAHIGRIDPDKATVDVAFESTTPWGINASCVETFDLSKAALLVGLRLNEFRNAASGRVETHRYTLSMSQPAEVDGVWIPTRLQLYAWSARQPEKITLHEGVMSDIRLSKLTAQDLEVAFPVGTKVSDQHTGARYEVGERGQQVPLLDGSEIVN